MPNLRAGQRTEPLTEPLMGAADGEAARHRSFLPLTLLLSLVQVGMTGRKKKKKKAPAPFLLHHLHRKLQRLSLPTHAPLPSLSTTPVVATLLQRAPAPATPGPVFRAYWQLPSCHLEFFSGSILPQPYHDILQTPKPLQTWPTRQHQPCLPFDQQGEAPVISPRQGDTPPPPPPQPHPKKGITLYVHLRHDISNTNANPIFHSFSPLPSLPSPVTLCTTHSIAPSLGWSDDEPIANYEFHHGKGRPHPCPR